VKSDRPQEIDSKSPPSAISRGNARHEQKTITNEIFSLKPPAAQNRAVLVRMDSVQAGQVTSLDGPELRMGRHPDSGLVLDDEGMSRSHARVFYEGGAYFLEDLGSSNGTYVDGKRITKLMLFDGAVVQLGPRVCFRFSLTDESQERILRQLYESSVRDPLTGAYNRHFFHERLRGELAYAERHNAHLSVLLFDIDHFKNVNDTHGHPAGDAVLRAVTSTTLRLLRVEDVLARYGGEEFIVLLRGVPIEGARKAGERLRRAIEGATTDVAGTVIRITVSIGCASLACCERLGSDALISVADRRLYTAKHAGRNRVVAEG